jgi:hypothetical protein
MNDPNRKSYDLDAYLADLRDKEGSRGAKIPKFDPNDGGIEAKILFLFQDPGKSGAALEGGSGMVSRDNKDPSANLFKQITVNEVDLPRKSTVLWNACPWEATDSEGVERRRLREGGWIPKLLEALPNVFVVALMGGWARALTGDFYMAVKARPLIVLHGPHPSWRGQAARNGFSREDHRRWLRRVVEQAGELAGVKTTRS